MHVSAKRQRGRSLDDYSFAHDGFCVLRGVVDAATVEALRHDQRQTASSSADGSVCQMPALDDSARTEREAHLHYRGCPNVSSSGLSLQRS